MRTTNHRRSSLRRQKLTRSLLHTALGTLLALVVSFPVLLAQGEHTKGEFHRCPPEGRNGDPALNQQKNRDLPPDTYEDMTIQHFLDSRPTAAIAMGKRHRDQWTSQALESIKDSEARAARVEGRLIAIRTQGPEACNCGSSADVDSHLWIATKPSRAAKGTASMVVEISPRELGDHQGWRHDTLVALARKGARVRISGWVTWDQEHGSEVGKSRGTLWEVHPIHKIEVFQNGDWVDLDELR